MSKSCLEGGHPAGPVIRCALQRRGMTLGQAEAAAGFRQGEASRWLSGARGKGGVFRDQLARFVDVLQAPELYGVIRWKWRRWRLTCTECGAIRECEPAQFRVQRNRGFNQEAVVDEVAGSGTEICRKCKQSTVGHRSPVGVGIAKVRKRSGKAGLTKRMPKLTPQQQREGLEKAHEANRGRPRGPEERRRHAVGNIRARPVGRWGPCRGCGYAAFGKPGRPVLMHRACQDAYRREHQKAFGQPPYPPRPEGQHLSPEKMASAFELCVRHLLRGEPIGEPPAPGLAREFGFESRRGAQKRIEAFIDLLPPDGRGGTRLAFWARALREAHEGTSQRSS